MPALPEEQPGFRVRVRGLVQGVGFRPFVWRLAHEEGLKGHVLNDSEGVLAEIEGSQEASERFLQRLEAECPPLARIDAVEVNPLDAPAGEFFEGFKIISSSGGNIATGVVPDAATCPDCLAEILDPNDRRFGYAFTSCTHCGPRLSIIRAIPYDRAETSMAPFVMCEKCQAEYENPADRRFHAQPNACPECGPELWGEQGSGRINSRDAISWAAERLKAGDIIAVKGIGGYHLAVDATQSNAVARLRKRKNRPDKPLALMARDIAQVRKICHVSAAEEAHLTDRAAPIVLLQVRGEAQLAAGLAPGQDRLGVMLPYTPLHHLLMRALDGPLVLTSGNLSDEPQVTGNDEARSRLAGIADGFLMHDRDIVNRLDDSVVRISGSGPAMMRRARGYTPAPLRLHPRFKDAPNILALGGELKSTFCMLRQGDAVVSQHIGDLETRPAFEDFKKNIGLYKRLYGFVPDVIAVDQHPDYLSTQYGKQLADESGARLVEVQHHHAHLAACLAEAGIAPGDDQSLAIVLDGSGLGTDGSIWGGELLVGGYSGFNRVGHFLPVALPGGHAAIREPWRNLAAHLFEAFGPDYRSLAENNGLPGVFKDKNLSILEQMIIKGINAPLSSSAGRLFDAVAAALGVCPDRQTYEGQTGSVLESMARPYVETERGYPVKASRDELADEVAVFSWKPLWDALLTDLRQGVTKGRIAARFHLALVESLTETSVGTAVKRRLRRIVLSGGVMQNSILADCLAARLSEHGLEVLLPRNFPANDGGISLGQASIAAATGLSQE